MLRIIRNWYAVLIFMPIYYGSGIIKDHSVFIGLPIVLLGGMALVVLAVGCDRK